MTEIPRLKLLLVDDEISCLEGYHIVLKPARYDCVLESDPLRALERYRLESFDAVISDFRMPGMNGIELLREIRKINPEAKVIIITAYGDIDNAMDAVNNKAWAFFGKPVDFNDLLSTLQEIEKIKTNGGKQIVHIEELQREHEKLKTAYESLVELMRSSRREDK